MLYDFTYDQHALPHRKCVLCCCCIGVANQELVSTSKIHDIKFAFMCLELSHVAYFMEDIILNKN